MKQESKQSNRLIHELKALISDLDASEKEMLKDELLAILLFGDEEKRKQAVDNPADSKRGLTNEEKELIRKLAAQTEALFRRNEKKDSDNH